LTKGIENFRISGSEAGGVGESGDRNREIFSINAREVKIILGTLFPKVNVGRGDFYGYVRILDGLVDIFLFAGA